MILKRTVDLWPGLKYIFCILYVADCDDDDEDDVCGCIWIWAQYKCHYILVSRRKKFATICVCSSKIGPKLNVDEFIIPENRCNVALTKLPIQVIYMQNTESKNKWKEKLCDLTHTLRPKNYYFSFILWTFAQRHLPSELEDWKGALPSTRIIFHSV